MPVPFRIAALAAGLVLFAVLHSLLAATSVRARLERRIGIRFYRLAYNVVALVTLGLPFVFTRGRYPTLWEASGVLAALLRTVQLAGAILFFAALRHVDLGHLAGVRQLCGHLHERGGLQTGGVFARCRHPLYLGACLFATAAPHMDARGLVVAIWMWSYSYIGACLEERKLHRQFGDAYRRYCATTPRLLPRLWHAPQLLSLVGTIP